MEIQDKHHRVSFASLSGKQVEAAFDGGILTSLPVRVRTQTGDSGVMLIREVEAKIGILRRITEALTDSRHPSYVDHSLADLVIQRVFQMACGYEDANDCNALRTDPGFKAACDRLPVSGAALASQPTMSRLENRINRRDLYRIGQAFADGFIASYKQPPEAILLDIDDTEDKVYGSQQLSLFNAYFKSHCYQPLHIYEGQTGKLITTILRPGARPSGKQIVSILKRVIAYLRRAWPDVAILLRGDSHFSCPEVHELCEDQDVYFALGQSGNAKLLVRAQPLMDQAKALYAASGKTVRLYTSWDYQASTWASPQRIICKAEVTPQGHNIRFVATNLHGAQPSFTYKTVYCGRVRMENFIKNHKTFLHSDRTSCHTFEANQFRLFLHSAAYVLLQTLAEIGLRGTTWTKAQVNTLQNRLLKVAGRVCEMKTKITFHLPTTFPLKHLYGKILYNLATSVP